MRSKKAVASKSLWANGITALLAIGSLLLNDPQVWKWVSAHPQVLSYLAMAGGILNVILRFTTSGGVFLGTPGLPAPVPTAPRFVSIHPPVMRGPIENTLPSAPIVAAKPQSRVSP